MSNNSINLSNDVSRLVDQLIIKLSIEFFENVLAAKEREVDINIVHILNKSLNEFGTLITLPVIDNMQDCGVPYGAIIRASQDTKEAIKKVLNDALINIIQDILLGLKERIKN